MLQVQFPGDLSGWWGEISQGHSVYRITLIIPRYVNPIITSFASFQAPHYGRHRLFSISTQCGGEDNKNAIDVLVKINVLLPTGRGDSTREGREWGRGRGKAGKAGRVNVMYKGRGRSEGGGVASRRRQMAQSPDVFRRKIWQTPTRVFVVPELRLFATGGFLERPETTVFVSLLSRSKLGAN